MFVIAFVVLEVRLKKYRCKLVSNDKEQVKESHFKYIYIYIYIYYLDRDGLRVIQLESRLEVS